jgi:hypothetical protein
MEEKQENNRLAQLAKAREVLAKKRLTKTTTKVYDFPVRRGLEIEIRLPIDATPSEIKRLAAFIGSLAMEEN